MSDELNPPDTLTMTKDQEQEYLKNSINSLHQLYSSVSLGGVNINGVKLSINDRGLLAAALRNLADQFQMNLNDAFIFEGESMKKEDLEDKSSTRLSFNKAWAILQKGVLRRKRLEKELDWVEKILCYLEGKEKAVVFDITLSEKELPTFTKALWDSIPDIKNQISSLDITYINASSVLALDFPEINEDGND